MACERCGRPCAACDGAPAATVSLQALGAGVTFRLTDAVGAVVQETEEPSGLMGCRPGCRAYRCQSGYVGTVRFVHATNCMYTGSGNG